jgi:hypothetical protein
LKREADMWSLETVNEINQAAARNLEQGVQQRETLRSFLVRDGVPRWYTETNGVVSEERMMGVEPT